MFKMFKAVFVVTTICGSGLAFAGLPIFQSGLTIKMIETSPNASDPVYGYTVVLASGMPETGCPNNDHFVVETGQFQDESLSLLLAAMMGEKKIQVRVVRCTDRPVVDRVGILSD